MIGSMALKVWFFLRPRVGEVRPVSLNKMDSFFSKGDKLESDEEGSLHYVEVIVDMEGRQALQVHGIRYFKVLTLPDGTLDRERHYEVVQASVDLAFGGLAAQDDDDPGIINAVSRFAERRLEHHRWQPTPADEKSLRDAINRKAGRSIL
jgi:hypothetical protein